MSLVYTVDFVRGPTDATATIHWLEQTIRLHPADSTAIVVAGTGPTCRKYARRADFELESFRLDMAALARSIARWKAQQLEVGRARAPVYVERRAPDPRCRAVPVNTGLELRRLRRSVGLARGRT